MSRMKHLLRKLHLSGDPPPPPPTSPPPTLPPPPPPPPPPPAVSHSNFRFKERENEAMTRFEEEYQVQLAMAISQSDPDGLGDPDSVQIKAAKQISLAVGGGDMGGLEMEILSLRYWNYNVVNYDEKIKDGFYDLYGTTSNSKLQVQVPTLLDLQSLSISQSMDFEAILVNRTLDPSLQQLEQKAQQIFLNNNNNNNINNNNINNNNYGLVREIAGIVVNYMGGTVEDTEEMQIKWYQKYLDLKTKINSCVIPLGLVDLGLSRHRALLFKVLADKLGLPCKLVRGGYYTGTDDGAVNFVKIDSHSEYMVDLMGAPGTLIPAEVPTNYFQNTENTPGSCSIITTQEEDNNSIQYLAPNNITQNNEHIPDLMSSTPILQNPENTPQLIESIENISKQEMQVNDVSKCLVTASRDPLFAGKLHAVLSENDASFPACFFSDIIEKGKDLESGGHGCDILEGPGCDIGKVGGQSENVVIDDVEMEIGWEELRVGERIGLGSYGEVYRADWHGTEVAVKKFLDQDLSGYALDQFRFEVKIMSRLRHPNIVLFMGAVTRPPNLSILTEFLPRGSLYRLLHRPNAPLDEKRRLKMAIDVARGMNYLHTSHPTIVHRDLKTPNLLVDKNWVVKVSDFGLSRLKHNTFLSSKSSGGTPEWMAPEVLRNEPSNEKCDVYSYGVILWELATMQMPWSGLNPMQVVGAVGFQNKRLEVPAYVHPDVADIINSCFDEYVQC